MKRIFSILLLLIIFNSCDDGDIQVDNIDFSEVAVQKCSDRDVLYKISNSEMLLLAIPAETFINDETPENQPIETGINSTNQVNYRFYQGTASSDNICPTIPSATPNLAEEWKATAGIIQITSTAVKALDAETNATTITGYKYHIVFKNITFQKPDGIQIYETFEFGNFTRSITPLAFNFDTEVDKSTCDNRIFNFSGSESFILEVEDYESLFQNAVTTTPRTALISSSNKLTYKVFSNTVNDAFFCTFPTPANPTVVQEWNALDGIADTNGIIEVTTTTFGTGFLHTIHLKKVTLERGNSDFYLGDNYVFGSFVTNP